MHISSPEMHRGKVLKNYHINYTLNLFPYYDIRENYNKNDQNNKDSFCKVNSCRVTVFLTRYLIYHSSTTSHKIFEANSRFHLK